MTAGLEVGLGLIILALALLVSVWIVGSWQRARRTVTADFRTDSASPSPSSPHSNEAILIVQAGGRIEYINELARKWFGFRSDEFPDLERVFRRVRPLEEFIELCARPGQKRISISGQLVNATSYQVPGPHILMLLALRSVEPSKDLAEPQADASVLKIITDFGAKRHGRSSRG
jgi:hypothetical protein